MQTAPAHDHQPTFQGALAPSPVAVSAPADGPIIRLLLTEIRAHEPHNPGYAAALQAACTPDADGLHVSIPAVTLRQIRRSHGRDLPPGCCGE